MPRYDFKSKRQRRLDKPPEGATTAEIDGVPTVVVFDRRNVFKPGHPIRWRVDANKTAWLSGIIESVDPLQISSTAKG